MSYNGKKNQSIAQQKTVNATPNTPDSGYSKIYPKDDGQWYYLDDSGIEHLFGGSSGGGVIDVGIGFGSSIRIDNCNNIADEYSTISGGRCNTTSSSYYGCNTISGGYCNTISGFYGGVTISGGLCNSSLSTSGQNNSYSTIGGGYLNCISAMSAVISGGMSNNIPNSGTGSTISGGQGNTASGRHSTVSGGYCNTIGLITTASGYIVYPSAVGGGSYNIISSHSGTYHMYGNIIAGGTCNHTVSSDYNGQTISGGTFNTTLNDFSIISGGANNTASGSTSTIGGGSGNTSSGASSTISGGWGNISNGSISTIGGGWCNLTTGNYSMIGGGCNNTSSNFYSTVGGGVNNIASGSYSTIGGGGGNTTLGQSSTVGGGDLNYACAQGSTISGGTGNKAADFYSTVGGGTANCACGSSSIISGGSGNLISSSGVFSNISGGWGNTVSNTKSIISGGCCNTVSGGFSTIGGGQCNTISSNGSAILGGSGNSATCSYSGIFGCNITSVASCTFHVNNLALVDVPSFDPTNSLVLVRDQSTGVVKQRGFGGLFAQTSSSTNITGTVTETSLISTGAGTLSVPANGFAVGDSFAAKLCGEISAANGETLRIRVKSGSVLLADTGIITLAGTTNKIWELMIDFTIRSLGLAGVASIASNGTFTHNKDASNAYEGIAFGSVNSSTFNTTILNTLSITAQWGSTNAANSIHSDIFVLDKTY